MGVRWWIIVGIGLWAATAEAQSLTHLMGIGGVTDDSAVYRARTDEAATIKIEYSTASDLSGSTISTGVLTASGDDFTGGETITGLSANTLYYYTILVDDVRAHSSPFPSFRTFPTEGVDASVTLIWSSCQTSPDHATIFAAIAAESPTVFLHLGDFGYPDSTVLATQRSNYQTQHGGDFLTEIVRKTPRVHVWDDHDFGGNNSNGDLANKANSLQAYKEYLPAYPLANGANGIWHSFKVANVEVFVMDLRYQREGSKPQFGVGLNLIADTGSSGTSLVLRSADSPSTFNDWYNSWYAEISTTSGTYVRRILDYVGATRTATLSASVPDLDDTSTYYLRRASMLDMDMIANGQTEWLIDAITGSTARWKVLVSSVAWNPTETSSDAWGAWDNSDIEAKYLRQELADVTNLIVISGDAHASAVDDGTTSDWPEASVGALNAPLYSIDGTWSNGTYSSTVAYGVLALDADEATITVKTGTGTTAGSITPLTIEDASGGGGEPPPPTESAPKPLLLRLIVGE